MQETPSQPRDSGPWAGFRQPHHNPDDDTDEPIPGATRVSRGADKAGAIAIEPYQDELHELDALSSPSL